MLGYLKAIFDWFSNIGGEWFAGLFNLLNRFKWFVVALLASLLAPIVWIFELAKDLTAGMAASSADVLGYMQTLGLGQAGGMWSSLAGGAALMNCVVPLDIMISSFGALLSLWLVILGIKAALFVYRHIPTIAGFGSNG
jgi:hypothetical protein